MHTVDPASWKCINFTGIPKDRKAITLPGLRWIGKLDCCLKWYIRCFLPALRPSLRTSSVGTLGFRHGFSCDDIAAIIMQTLFIAYRWGRPLVLGTADIATAFDTMEHASMQKALLGRGAHPDLVRAILREVSFMSGRISIQGAGMSNVFPFERGGKQGGVETPEVFNVMIEYALEPLVAHWEKKGFGFAFDDCERVLTHLIWADNIILFASSVKQFQIMAQELTDAICGIGFRWKPASLEYMLCGSLSGSKLKPDVVVVERPVRSRPLAPHSVTFLIREQLIILGTLYDQRGNTMVSLEYRLGKGEACFWKHVKTFRGPGRIGSKLDAWSSAPVPSAIFGSGCWHLSKEVLVRLRRWENNLLRKAFRLKWISDEGQMKFNQRTSNLIKGWFAKCCKRPIHYRVLQSVFDQAWREVTFTSHGNANYLAICRNYRSREWWELIKGYQHERIKEGLVHAGMGPRCEWEDVFCMAFDASWRKLRDSCDTYAAWNKLFPQFAATVCQRWGLPLWVAESVPKKDESARCPRRRPIEHNLEDLPSTHGEDCADIPWWRNAACFAFIVDCKPLADILNGKAPLKAPGLAPIFDRMTKMLFELILRNWSPHDCIADPITWQRREHNKKADFIVNHTMDRKQDWKREFQPPFSDFTLRDANLICHSDGGTRGEACSAAGWIIEASVTRDGAISIFPLVWCGKYFAEPLSSFLAEAIAVEDMITYISELTQ